MNFRGVYVGSSSWTLRAGALKESESDLNHHSQVLLTPDPNVAFCSNVKAQSRWKMKGREKRGAKSQNQCGGGKGQLAKLQCLLASSTTTFYVHDATFYFFALFSHKWKCTLISFSLKVLSS